MPHYVVSSEGPISVRAVERPDLPDRPGWTPEHPWIPGEEGPSTGGPPLRPGHPIYPSLPPKDEWPPLPPFLQPGVGLPIPPTPEFPMVPIPDPEPGEPAPPIAVWPPVIPPMPDVSGKTLALAAIYVSRHVARWHWVVIDHAAAKEAVRRAIDAAKDRLPAGGVGGRPPARPGGGAD